jgi:hypothetical protein
MALLKRTDLDHSLFIESHGVVIRLTSNEPEALVATLPEIRANLPGCGIIENSLKWDHEFAYIWNPGRLDAVYKNKEKVAVRRRRDWAFQLLGSQIRLTVAEFAPRHIFVHAGVVAVGGKAIVIPAKSFKGKTTLTAELVKRGAVYYSDEYAVIDPEGAIYPFPKDLSMRGVIDDRTQVEMAVEEFGGIAGTEPIRAALIVVTEYGAKYRWRPKTITSGQGFLELINHTVSIRQNTELAFKALGNLIKDAEIIKSRRGDAGLTAAAIIELIQKPENAAVS